MANSDTLAALFAPSPAIGVNAQTPIRGQLVNLVLASTTETAFSVATDTGTTVAVLTVPTGVTPVLTGLPAGSGVLVGSGSPMEFNLNRAISGQGIGRKGMGVGIGTPAPFYSPTTFDMGRAFRVRIVGQCAINAGASNTVALNLYVGTSATLASDTKVAALGAGGTPSTSVNFVLETFLQWDSTTLTLGGYYQGQCGNTFTAQHALSNAASVTSAAGLTFVASAVFANAGGGTCVISEFSIEQV